MPKTGEPPPASTTTAKLIDRRKKLPFLTVERVVLRTKALSNTAKLLYMFLDDYAGQDDNCFPGQDRLAKDLRLKTDRQVRRLLDELRRVKLVDWKQQGLNSPNVYYLMPIEGETKLLLAAPRAPIVAPSAPSKGRVTRLGRTYMSAPERTSITAQDRTYMSDKQDSVEQDSVEQQHTQVDTETKRRDVVVPLIERQHQERGQTAGAARSQKAPTQSPAPPAELDALGLASLTNGLAERGVALAVAQKWLRQRPPEYLQQLLEYHDWCQKHRPGFIKDSGAWLSTALASAIVFPDFYLKAKAGGRHQAEEDARAAEEQARQQAKELQRRATELAQDPGDWARHRLQTYEDSQKILGRPPLTEVQRREREAQYATNWIRQRDTFIAEHPEFTQLLGRAPEAAVDVPPPPDEELEATTQAQLEAWQQERHATQGEQSQPHASTHLARSPEEQAEDALRGLDDNADALGQPRLSGGARVERRRSLVTQFRTDRESNQQTGEAHRYPRANVQEGHFHGPDEPHRTAAVKGSLCPTPTTQLCIRSRAVTADATP